MRWAGWATVLWMSACGGIVTVEGDDTANGDGPRSIEDPSSTPAEEHWQPQDGCVDSCASWMSSCANDRLCTSPHDLCAPSEADRAKDLVVCVCAGCAARCGGNCELFDSTLPACLECQQTMVRETCNFEYYECVGF